ncbi:MAG: Uncharacterised protein [Cellulomonadaceae bacterium TMED98]|nr:MAG: Uncharacterised protein [Cellulomonadaceae bacterium TMED98]
MERCSTPIRTGVGDGLPGVVLNHCANIALERVARIEIGLEVISPVLTGGEEAGVFSGAVHG